MADHTGIEWTDATWNPIVGCSIWHFGSLTPRVSAETYVDEAPDLYRLGKKAAGRLLDGRE